MRAHLILFFAATGLCAAVTPNYQPPTTDQLNALVPAQPVEHCVSKAGRPDPKCTPGAVLTTNKDEVCNKISTKSVRPPSGYTNKLKKAQIVEYGFEDVDADDYEEDHLISLVLGGHPYDPKNLWPEPHGGKNGSEQKDKVEVWLAKQVCTGAIPLEDAQKGIASDWRQYLKNVTPYKARKVKENE